MTDESNPAEIEVHPDPLIRLVEGVWDTHAAYLPQTDQIIQSFFLESDAENVIVMAPWNNDEEKAMTLAGLRGLIEDKRITRYAFVSEAWISHRAGKEGGRPSQQPDRKELLFVVGVEPSGRIVSKQAEIHRNDAGKRCLDEITFHDTASAEAKQAGVGFAGSLTNLFRPDDSNVPLWEDLG